MLTLSLACCSFERLSSWSCETHVWQHSWKYTYMTIYLIILAKTTWERRKYVRDHRSVVQCWIGKRMRQTSLVCALSRCMCSGSSWSSPTGRHNNTWWTKCRSLAAENIQHGRRKQMTLGTTWRIQTVIEKTSYSSDAFVCRIQYCNTVLSAPRLLTWAFLPSVSVDKVLICTDGGL